MKKIELTSRKELDIYMNPMRQQMLRLMSISHAPMTPKMLADRLKISASGVQHHIKKLLSLGVIELDHTEIINGITASFYKPTKVTIQIGLDKSGELKHQREVLVQDLVAQVYEGYRTQMKKRLELENERKPERLKKWGDILTGVVHLNEKESERLMKLVSEFFEQHAVPKEGTDPWEYAIIAYNAGEQRNE